MPFEPTVVLLIGGAGVVFLFLFLPFVIAVTHVGAVWRASPGTGLLLLTVILLTLIMYGTLMGVFTRLVSSGSQLQ